MEDKLHNQKFDLTSNVAIVTGGAGLLGFEHASCLTTAGAIVYLADINKKKCEQISKKIGKNCLPIYMDVSNEKSVEEVSSFIFNQNKRIDILINNAAINPSTKKNSESKFSRLENFKLSDWVNEINVGLTGSFLCSKYFGSIMASLNKGVILNIASDLSVIAPSQDLYKLPNVKDEEQPVKPITYSVVKTGLIGLTRYLASYWAKNNLRVNALSPGGILDNQPEEFLERIANKIPLGRMANKDEYREAVLFLCSEASSYMTGQNIVMDGGRSII